MTVLEVNKLKRKVIAKAWLEEKRKILNNTAQRDWTSYQQRQLIKFHRCYSFVAQPLYSNYYNLNNSSDYIQMLDFEFEFIDAHSKNNKNCLFGYFSVDDGKVYQNKKNNQIKVTFLNPLFENKRQVFVGQVDEYGVVIGSNNKSSKKKINDFGVNRK